MAFLPLIAIAIALCVAAIVGFSACVGWVGAILLMAACCAFRLLPVLVVAAFFGARDGWGWHWVFALLFVSPGIISVLSAPTWSVARRVRKMGSR